MQASRKCTFAPLAGAKPLTPMPPSGGSLRGHRPQKGKMADKYETAGQMVASAPAHSSPQKALCGLFVFELIPEPPQKEKRTHAACGRFSLTNFQKGLQSLPRLYIIASEDTSQRTTQHGNLYAFPLAFWATQRRNRVNELF